PVSETAVNMPAASAPVASAGSLPHECPELVVGLEPPTEFVSNHFALRARDALLLPPFAKKLGTRHPRQSSAGDQTVSEMTWSACGTPPAISRATPTDPPSARPPRTGYDK